MTVREYIGARYVPLFMGTWDSTVTYEPLSIVQYQGNSYTSRQSVPAGIAITNETYWAPTGGYNAQVEAYREEVLRFDGRITANSEAINDLENDLDTFENTVNADNWVTTNRIANGAVTNDKLSQDVKSTIAAVSSKSEMILIGDSWSEFYSGQMATSLGAYLNCTVHNYAVASMGFIQGATNFQRQADQAYEDTTVNADNVKYIVIIGGSNDVSNNNYNAYDIATAIQYICDKLLSKFKKATVHVAYNTRFKAGSTAINKLNLQNRLFNGITDQIASRNIKAISHPNSVAWMSRDQFDSSLSHIGQDNTKKWAQYLAGEITGQQIDYLPTGRTVVPLDGNDNVNGNCYFAFTNRRIEVFAYVVVANDITNTHTGIKYSASGLFPLQLWNEPAVLQETNRLIVPLGRINGAGNANLELAFNSSDGGGDTVYLNCGIYGGDNTVHAGRYFGSGVFNLI